MLGIEPGCLLAEEIKYFYHTIISSAREAYGCSAADWRESSFHAAMHADHFTRANNARILMRVIFSLLFALFQALRYFAMALRGGAR